MVPVMNNADSFIFWKVFKRKCYFSNFSTFFPRTSLWVIFVIGVMIVLYSSGAPGSTPKTGAAAPTTDLDPNISTQSATGGEGEFKSN